MRIKTRDRDKAVKYLIEAIHLLTQDMYYDEDDTVTIVSTGSTETLITGFIMAAFDTVRGHAASLGNRAAR